MIASMTAFCRLQSDQTAGSLIWEIRSVNHRYLDVHLRLPEELRSLETPCRELFQKQFGRGRIDAALRFDAAEQHSPDLAINMPALAALGKALETVGQQVASAGPASLSDILRWPGVLQQQSTDLDSLGNAALTALKEAISELQTARQREGCRLREIILERVASCGDIASTLRQQLSEIELDMKARWQRRLDELGDEVEPARLSQELALLLTRSDVSEELDRLDTHLGEVERVLDANKPAGRRLDFLMQELNREANTLGSKSVDLRNTNASVELKVLIDQMREQVQNIE